jgi:hypothetical protein
VDKQYYKLYRILLDRITKWNIIKNVSKGEFFLRINIPKCNKGERDERRLQDYRKVTGVVKA